jgi:hypothetical protein
LKKILFGLAFSLSLLTNAAIAHHSRANFDSDTVIELTGTVVDYSWRNPHVYMQIEALDSAGVMQSWLIESHSVTGMRGNGWDGETLQIGEHISISGSPDFNADKHFVLLNYVDKTDGQRLYAFGNRNAPRTQPLIEPSEDFSGTWAFDLRSFDIRAAGGGPPADWSYTEAGLEMGAQFHVNENPELECLHIGVPRIVAYPYGMNWERQDDRILIHKEHLDEKRTVWLDANAEALTTEAPSYTGTSYGYFESDNHLVIETNNFLPTKWGSANGVNSSDQKSVVEHYWLADDGMSKSFSFTITDPLYLTEPATVSGNFNKAQNRDLIETACDPAAASRHLTVEQ